MLKRKKSKLVSTPNKQLSARQSPRFISSENKPKTKEAIASATAGVLSFSFLNNWFSHLHLAVL
jgi:hypothetical protein